MDETKEKKDFIISLDLSKKKVSELKYDQKGGTLRIYITPEEENLTIEDFEFSRTGEPAPKTAVTEKNAGLLKQLKVVGLLLKRLAFNEKRQIYITYVKKEEIGD